MQDFLLSYLCNVHEYFIELIYVHVTLQGEHQ